MIWQRKHPRYNAALPVHLLASGRRLAGTTDSISKGGLFFPTMEPLDDGLEVKVHLKLPGGRGVGADGQVAYVIDPVERRIGDAGMGIRFDGFDTDGETAFDLYLADLARRVQGTVLVVDDNVATARLLRTRLREADYRVSAVHDVFNALDILRFGEVQILIVENSLGRMSGLDLAETVRHAGGYIEIILMTRENLNRVEADRAAKLGITAIFRKPADVKAIRRAVDVAALAVSELELPEGVDPWDRDTVVSAPITTDHAARQLEALGVTTRRKNDGTLFGTITFLHQRVHMPFDRATSVPRARVALEGHDQIRIVVPRPFSNLPPISFRHLTDQRALERSITAHCRLRTEECAAHRAWLDRLGVASRLDQREYACLGTVIIDGETLTFRVVNRSLVVIEALRGYTVADRLTEEEREVHLSAVQNEAHLRRELRPAWERTRAAIITKGWRL